MGWDRTRTRRTGYPAYRVVLNPRPSDLGIAPAYLSSAYRADAPTTTVLSRSVDEPTRTARFRVPEATPPGLYMVLIWDGGEGGAHNTWDYLHVTHREERDAPGVVARRPDRPAQAEVGRRTPREPARPAGTTAWPLIAGAGLAGLVLGAAGGAAARRRT